MSFTKEDVVLRGATFKRGGIHPLDKKSLSKDKKIEVLPIPSELVVSLSQHIGAPAKCVVNKGDRVERGQLIGEAQSFVSASIHSPVRGTVVDIRKNLLATGVAADCVVIKSDEEQPDLFSTPYDWRNESKEEILKAIRDYGLVGMGGATFPTSVKFSIPEGKKVEYLVINAVECEPYLTCDYRLMKERTSDIIEGIMIASKVLSPEKIIIGVEANKEDAALLLESKAKEMGFNLTVALLKMKYPQGDEKQLLYALTGRAIPSGKLPLDIGCIVCNTSSIIALYEAIKFHKPLIERVMTVTGEAIGEPKNLLVPIGTTFKTLFEYCSGDESKCNEIISGGPMMGFGVPNLTIPTVKGTNGLLCILSKEEKTFNCVNCGKCVQHCPMGLRPNRMYRLITNKQYKDAMDIGLMDCKECGCCAYSCSSHLNLVQTFKLGKKLGREKK